MTVARQRDDSAHSNLKPHPMNTANSLSAPFNNLLPKMLQGSRYAKRLLDADPALLIWLQENYATPCTGSEIQAWLQQLGLDLTDETQLSSALRKIRKQVMLKLILRDLNGLADLQEVMHAMTSLAEICLQHAQACLMQSLQAQFGSPMGESGTMPQALLVIGMGKLGGGELNVSSDIDLIFVYPDDGDTDAMSPTTGNETRSISNSEFFTRLGRGLINAIADITSDGQVFRVDMRLRPNGDSGPLVCSFNMLENYFITQGREWERYAWIKARPLTGERFDELEQIRRPFVFRKYLDFGAINAMRDLHAQIRHEVMKKDQADNVKLGPGGIREIEFIAQVFQLIRGGRDAALQVQPTLAVLQLLSDNRTLPSETVLALAAAYDFLRRVEHRLQYLDDAQTHRLPTVADDQQRVAQAMNFVDFAALTEALNSHRALVSSHFDQIFASPDADQHPLAVLWLEANSEAAEEFERLGFRDPKAAAVHVAALRPPRGLAGLLHGR